MPSLSERLMDADAWEAFYAYKASLASSGPKLKELRSLIDERVYRVVAEEIRNGSFPLARRSVISKMGSEKKRVVYSYPAAHTAVLKLLTWQMLRRYDAIFSDNLYSFRPGRTAKEAVQKLAREQKRKGCRYAYKVDISNYFNSIPVDRLLPVLREVLADDPELFLFLADLLSEPAVLERGEAITEEKGIMAGTPQSAFFANLYLMDLDRSFAERDIPYARYSDDILVLGHTMEEVEEEAARIRAFLAEKGLRVNPDKEDFFGPDEGWVFLGFLCRGDAMDIAPATVRKLKQKMRRKTRSLLRWSRRNGVSGEKAAKAFIRIFNRKLLESGEEQTEHELTWSLWFFPVINRTESLAVIDHYAQECIRVIAEGTHTKARFNLRYEEMKAMGYRSLVHEYYAYQKRED